MVRLCSQHRSSKERMVRQSSKKAKENNYCRFFSISSPFDISFYVHIQNSVHTVYHLQRRITSQFQKKCRSAYRKYLPYDVHIYTRNTHIYAYFIFIKTISSIWEGKKRKIFFCLFRLNSFEKKKSLIFPLVHWCLKYSAYVHCSVPTLIMWRVCGI